MAGWYKTHMHIHTSFEYRASMRSHAEQARRYGVDAMFITDHDVRMNRFADGIEHFRLKAEGAAFVDGTGWHFADSSPARAVRDGDGYSLLLPPGQTVFFDSRGKRHQTSLLAGVTCAMDFYLPEHVSLKIGLVLSQNRDQEMQHLYYEIGDCPSLPGDWVIPLPEQRGRVHVELPVSEDILRFDELGQDNCFASIALTAYGGEGALCRSFDTERIYVAEAVRLRQKELARRISAEYGVALYPATEISLSSGGRESHHLSLSDSVPVINYEDVHYSWQADDALAYVRALGGTFSINHPLGKFKRGYEKDTRAQRRALIEALVGEYREKQCYGVQLIETGFPAGRFGFTWEEQLEVADELAMLGFRLTSYGDSDSHDSTVGWADGNNFAAWIWADSLAREQLEAGLRSGRVYSADTARWHGVLEEFTVNGAEMGCTIEAAKDTPLCLRAGVSGLTEALICRVMVSGVCVHTAPLTGDAARFQVQIKKGRGVLSPARLELLAQSDGRCILQTNPVYIRSFQEVTNDSNRRLSGNGRIM